MPRNMCKPLDVEPINVPLSSVTVVAQVVGIVETMEITAQSVTRNARGKPILAFENYSLIREHWEASRKGAHALSRSRVVSIRPRDDPGFPRKFKFS
jgi:hypothetical protein